ncbi:MAG: RNA ligase (ATP) [Planctomycetota bacterium]
MERKLATIQVVKEIRPIPDADAIECADILGWHLVVKKGQFKPGDKCVYFEIDSLLPERPQFEFLRKSCWNARLAGFRIKTVTMRGQISQGIAFPLSILPQGNYNVGDDVTELLGIRKYEPPVPACLTGVEKGPIPPIIPKTDEPRIQIIPEVLERYREVRFYVTEKLDGTSCTIYHHQGTFGACGRTYEYEEDETNTYWKVAKMYDLRSKLAAAGSIAIQGEIVGPNIQDNIYKLPNHKLFVFNVFEIEKHRYLGLNEMRSLCTTLGLEPVPLIDDDFHLPLSVDELVQYSQAASVLYKDTIREGVVVRPVEEIKDPTLGRLSFKVVNPRYLLKREVQES